MHLIITAEIASEMAAQMAAQMAALLVLYILGFLPVCYCLTVNLLACYPVGPCHGSP
jgi:hypothetical protein